MSIVGNMAGCYSPMGKTFIITDENGNELTGVITDQEQIFTATDNDVREGFVYASDSGVSIGSKVIPSYHTSYGCKIVLANKEVTISAPEYDYSDLSVIISTYDTSMAQSVLSTYVSINGAMYMAGSNVKVSDITVDRENEKINLGIALSQKSVIRYLVTREEN